MDSNGHVCWSCYFFPFVEVLPVVEFVLEEGIRYMYISRLGTFVALRFEIMFGIGMPVIKHFARICRRQDLTFIYVIVHEGLAC